MQDDATRKPDQSDETDRPADKLEDIPQNPPFDRLRIES